ncbi:MAG: hypothetical protein ACRET3_07150, partial [Burkholderiales bacterium]
AMIHALARLRQGDRPSYAEAMSAGLRSWGRLLVARFVAGLMIGLGLIALVVPGVLLLVRYALLDAVVVLEGAGPGKARRRSTQLTVGVRGQIFTAGLLFLVAFSSLAFLAYLPLVLFPELDTMAMGIVLDCFMDVAFAVIQIVMFLYYWQAAGDPALRTATAEAPQRRPEAEP